MDFELGTILFTTSSKTREEETKIRYKEREKYRFGPLALFS